MRLGIRHRAVTPGLAASFDLDDPEPRLPSADAPGLGRRELRKSTLLTSANKARSLMPFLSIETELASAAS